MSLLLQCPREGLGVGLGKWVGHVPCSVVSFGRKVVAGVGEAPMVCIK